MQLVPIYWTYSRLTVDGNKVTAVSQWDCLAQFCAASMFTVQFVNKNILSTFNKVPLSLVLLLRFVFIPGLIVTLMCTQKSITLHFCCFPPNRFKTVHCLLYANTGWCPKAKPHRKDWELWSKPAEPTVHLPFIWEILHTCHLDDAFLSKEH